MKFAFTADWHLSAYSQDNLDKETRLPRTLSDIINTLENMIKYCISNSIETIIVGGDLLHGKSIIYSIAQSCLLDLFRKYQEINFIVIDGNHDLSGKSKKVVSALKSIDKELNVYRIGKYLEDKDNSILYVPYSYNMSNIIMNNKADYLISHFGLNEGMLNSGISVVSDLSINDLSGKYSTVLLGHYHKPQKIIRKDVKLYYVGSPIQLDWGEKHEEKRFLVVDTEENKIESILTEGYRKYYSLPIKLEDKKSVLEEAKRLQNLGHSVRIERVENIDLKEESNDFKIVDRVEKDITNRGITSELSERDKLVKYTEIKQIPENKRQKYVNLALDVIENCNEII